MFFDLGDPGIAADRLDLVDRRCAGGEQLMAAPKWMSAV